MPREIRLDLEHVTEDQERQDVLVFRSADGQRLTISVGLCEGMAIRQSRDPRGHRGNAARPMTHDLLAILLDRFGARLQRVIIDDFWRGTYFAKLEFLVDGQPLAVDARPSDAVALALRNRVGVFATTEVLERATDADASDPLAADDAPPAY